MNGALPDGYLTFQPADSDTLPTDTVYYYGFHVQEGSQEMPPPKRINGIEDFDEALMVLGLYNGDSSKINVQVEYFAQRDDDNEDSNSLDFSQRKMFVRYLYKKTHCGNYRIGLCCSFSSALYWWIFNR